MLRIPIFCRYLTVLDDWPYLFQDWRPRPVAIQTNWDIIKTSVKMSHLLSCPLLLWIGSVIVRDFDIRPTRGNKMPTETQFAERCVRSHHDSSLLVRAGQPQQHADAPTLIKRGFFLSAVTPSCQRLWSFYSPSDTESSGFSLGTRGSLVPMVAPICQRWTGYQKLLNKSNTTAKTDISAPHPWNRNKKQQNM